MSSAMAFSRRQVMGCGAAASLVGMQGGLASPVLDQTRAVLQRLIGARARDFDFVVSANVPLRSYRFHAEHGRVAIESGSAVGLLRGAYAYLRSVGAAQINWEGDHIALPEQWPQASETQATSPFRHCAYFNPCTYGYTMPFWDWPRWQREIDWMALHGIDMPLAMEGQEYIWHRLWSQHGLSEAELQSYFSGPAFLPWHRMGNIEGYSGPLPWGWIEKKRELQIRILEQMRGLGMSPVLPAFAGYVPKAVAVKHPDARIHKMPAWGGFHETYWLDPTDPLFSVLARQFLELYSATYGEGTHYLADAFNEMKPPIKADDGSGGIPSREAQLSMYGSAIYRSIQAVRPEAVFVMQGWLFSFQSEFWDPASVAAFFKEIPDDKVMVLDIANDSYPGVWKKDNAYGGKSWVFGYIHNFGGNNPMFGDFDLYRRDLTALPADKTAGNLIGFGIFPEGLNTNSVAYEYLLDLAWGQNQSIEEWLPGYLKARYGTVDAPMLSAWSEVCQAAYRTSNWGSAWWKGVFGTYLFCKRPKPELLDFDAEPKDLTLLKKAVMDLLGLTGRYGQSDLFRYDLIAATTHLVSLQMDQLLLVALHELKGGDVAAADKAWSRVKLLCLELENLMGAQPFGLSRWLSEAARYGDTPAQANYYVENARTQVTVWGGEGVLNDYASKAWQGLYRDFYLSRWRRYYRALRTATLRQKAFDEKQFSAELSKWEWHWARHAPLKARHLPRHPYDDVRKLLSLV